MCFEIGRFRFGRRGTVLVIFGVIWAIIGVSIPGVPPPPPGPSRFLFHENMPHWFRMTLWFVTGGIAIVMAPMREPLGRDRWGFTALVVMPIERCASYFVAWVVHLLPLEGDVGYDRGWSAGAVWAAVTAVIIVCAGWPEPSRRVIAPSPSVRHPPPGSA